MQSNPQTATFGYRRCPEQDGASACRPVVVIGAGPVGLAASIDLAQQGVPVVLLDDDCALSPGSRAICFAKRTLDILDRLGCAERAVAKGVSWHVGKVFCDEDLVYRFDLLPEAGHRRPAFINLQQYYLEGFLVDRAAELAQLDLRWRHRVTGLDATADEVVLSVQTPDGGYALRARYVVVADGARSPVRQMMGLESHGRTFRDRFLIADVRMSAPFPSERWFWFDPPFNRNQSALLHRQPDNVWRIDFQLGWDADPDLEKQPERVLPRIRALLGDDARFELEWVSVYTFSCQRMDRFRHGRVLFAGDAAHRVSPFGARGANSGIQDAENVAWKLRMVLEGRAPDALLDTYACEREFAADENILNSSRSTDFITPKSAASRALRDGVLGLARRHPFARRLVNSGRLSVPAVLSGSPLNTPDAVPNEVLDGARHGAPGGNAPFGGAMAPGAAGADAPVRSVAQTSGNEAADAGWLLGQTRSGRFTVFAFAGGPELPPSTEAALRRFAQDAAMVDICCIVPPGTHANACRNARSAPGRPAEDVFAFRIVEDSAGLAAQRYDGAPGTIYLLRPDQHVCARWRSPDAATLERVLASALRTALGHDGVAWRGDAAPGAAETAGKLNTEPNLARPDDVYEALVGLHAGLDDAQSASVNARLLLLLANHVGDEAVLREAIALARADLPGAPAVAAPDARPDGAVRAVVPA